LVTERDIFIYFVFNVIYLKLVFIFYLFISNFRFYYYIYHLIFLVFRNHLYLSMCLAPITFLLPKSQLQGHFSLCPAAEKPSYLKLSLKNSSESEGVRAKKQQQSLQTPFSFLSPNFWIKHQKTQKNSWMFIMNIMNTWTQKSSPIRNNNATGLISLHKSTNRNATQATTVKLFTKITLFRTTINGPVRFQVRKRRYQHNKTRSELIQPDRAFSRSFPFWIVFFSDLNRGNFCFFVLFCSSFFSFCWKNFRNLKARSRPRRCLFSKIVWRNEKRKTKDVWKCIWFLKRRCLSFPARWCRLVGPVTAAPAFMCCVGEEGGKLQTFSL